MAIDFFQRQDAARQRTTRLLVLFGIGVSTLIGLLYSLAAFVFLVLEARADQPPPSLWNPGLFLAVAGCVLVVVLGGSLMKAGQLASGGKAVALMLNGRELLGTTRDLKERRLLNVVEEMAIAAGVPMPPVYVLPEEAINAFAAGHSSRDVVVAVSQGCLTYLTRDELQGVVGHEFSHILNGDVRLNLRIVVLVFGIMALSQVGYVIMRFVPSNQSSDDKKDSSGGIFLLGLGLYLLGMGGAFFGWLIQAAVSRQRESLADASAVQFTRNPEGLAGALKKIGGLEAGSRIENPHAGEVSHLFLSDAFMGRRLSSLLATHPPLEERIRALDPQFDGSYPEVKPLDEMVPETTEPKRDRLPPIMNRLPQVLGLTESADGQVGQVQPHHVSYAAELQTNLPQVLADATQEPFSARALIYCLLLDPKPEVRDVQIAQLRTGAGPRDFQEVSRLMQPVQGLSDAARFPLVELTMPALRQMSPAQHQVFRAQVEALVNADHKVSLFEYALQCVLTRNLDAQYNQQRPIVRYRTTAQVMPQAVTVLSLLAWMGHEDEAGARAAFAAGLKAFSGSDSPTPQILPRAESLPRALHGALQTLAQAAPEVKRRVVAACAACIQTDKEVTVREGELLRAVCATLGCPLPPLVGEAKIPGSI